MHKQGQRCTELISKTANSLSGNVVSLMLLAVQKDNLEPNIKQAIKWTHDAFGRERRGLDAAIKKCLLAFPSLWYFTEFDLRDVEGGTRELELAEDNSQGRTRQFLQFRFEFHSTGNLFGRC